MLDTLLMSSKAMEDCQREWSVYKTFQKRRQLFNDKFKDHITSKTKPSTPMVNSFKLLTSAVKSSIPEASDAS